MKLAINQHLGQVLLLEVFFAEAPSDGFGKGLADGVGYRNSLLALVAEANQFAYPNGRR